MDAFMKGQGQGFFGYILWRLHDTIVRAYDEWQPEIGLFAHPAPRSSSLEKGRLGPGALCRPCKPFLGW